MAIRHNINIIQGATLAIECQLVNADDSPIDISNAVFSGQIRARKDNAKLADFSFGKIDVMGGFFIALIKSDITAGIIRNGYYDWFATWPNGQIDCLARGDANRLRSATQTSTDSTIDIDGACKKLKIRLISARSLVERYPGWPALVTTTFPAAWSGDTI